MTARAALLDAVAVFRELGWDRADLTQVADLPLGTPEQRRRALAGLRSGTWGSYGEVGPSTYGWIPDVDVDETMLAAFAVRVGVDARRTVQLCTTGPDDVFVPLVVARGAEFAQRVVDASLGGGRGWEDAASWNGALALQLVDAFDLPLPDDVGYLRDWAVFAGQVVGVTAPSLWNDSGPEAGRWQAPTIMRRFDEHLRAAVATGVPATGPLGQVFREAVRTGLVERQEAVALAFAALDAAARPGDRKVWASVLGSELGVTSAELVERVDLLVPVLATGEPVLVETFAPALVEGVDDDGLVDVLATALTARTAKALRVLIDSVAGRPRPADRVLDDLTTLLAPLTDHKDRALGRAATRLLEGWGAAVPVDADPAHLAVRGLWRPTPDVWQVPRFEPLEPTPDTLTDAAAVLVGRADGIADVETEHFVVLAAAVAHRDLDAARTALRGVRQRWGPGLAPVQDWVRGRLAADAGDTFRLDLVQERDLQVFLRLGELPVLLSEPSWVDLRIDPRDLADRLRRHADAGVAVAEGDLHLAVVRTDLQLLDDDVRAQIAACRVPVLGRRGRPTDRTAGELVAGYLEDPVLEPEVRVRSGDDHHSLTAVRPPTGMVGLSWRVSVSDDWGGVLQSAFPTWYEASMNGMGHSTSDDMGARLRQAARRAVPLGPAAAVNLLGAQRSFHPAAAADGSLAVVEAWERGLLRPGVADIRRLDGRTTPTAVAAFAEALLGVAEQGLLSIVWPVLDDLLVVSTTGQRLLAGTAEVADVMRRLVPEVLAAVDAGLAPRDALAVPGLRALAARPGGSRAVRLARAAVVEIPSAGVVHPPVTSAPAPLDPPFDTRWPEGAGTAPAVVDGAAVTVGSCDPSTPTKAMFVDLDLGEPGAVRLHLGWLYPARTEGQLAGLAVGSGLERPPAEQSWVRWDDEAGRLTLSPHRDREHESDDVPSRGAPVPPVTSSLVAVLLVAVCQDGDNSFEGLQTIDSLVRRGEVGSAVVTSALRTLGSPDLVSPARLVRVVDRHPATLPATWPVLTESVRVAAARAGGPPRWLNAVLDTALQQAPYLREAAARGYLPADQAAWPGLATLASSGGRSAGARKAGVLLEALGLGPG